MDNNEKTRFITESIYEGEKTIYDSELDYIITYKPDGSYSACDANGEAVYYIYPDGRGVFYTQLGEIDTGDPITIDQINHDTTLIYSGGAEPFFKDDEIFVANIPVVNKNSNVKFINSNKLKELILEFIKTSSNGRTRQEINEFIYSQMNEDLETKSNRVRTSLTYLRKKDLIENVGSDTKSVWIAK